MAIAADLYEADLCRGCGQPRTYSMDPDSRGHYHSPDPAGCNGCRALHAAQKGKKGEPYLYYHVEPDEALAAAMESGPVRDDPFTAFLAKLDGSAGPPSPEPPQGRHRDQD